MNSSSKTCNERHRLGKCYVGFVAYESVTYLYGIGSLSFVEFIAIPFSVMFALWNSGFETLAVFVGINLVNQISIWVWLVGYV